MRARWLAGWLAGWLPRALRLSCVPALEPSWSASLRRWQKRHRWHEGRTPSGEHGKCCGCIVELVDEEVHVIRGLTGRILADVPASPTSTSSCSVPHQHHGLARRLPSLSNDAGVIGISAGVVQSNQQQTTNSYHIYSSTASKSPLLRLTETIDEPSFTDYLDYRCHRARSSTVPPLHSARSARPLL
eukprot:COSAG01_NODE_467_length_16597_cov_10.933446_8_plen_187_part_00